MKTLNPMRIINHVTMGVFLFLTHQLLAKVYNVTDFGAVNDGKTMNTASIQKAIDQCTKDGGGTVLLSMLNPKPSKHDHRTTCAFPSAPRNSLPQSGLVQQIMDANLPSATQPPNNATH